MFFTPSKELNPHSRLLRFCRLQVQAEAELTREIRLPNQASKQLGGVLRIGGASTLMRSCVLPILGKLLRANPDVRLEFMAREIGEHPRLLQSGQVDIVVTCWKMTSSSLEEIALGHEENVLVRSRKSDAVPDLYLDHDSEDQMTYRFFKFQGMKNISLNRAFLDDIYGILDGVSEGVGQAVVPMHLARHDARLEVVKGYRHYRAPVYLYHLRQPFYSKLILAAIRTIQSQMPRKLDR